jgi:hypothetical protein
MQTQTHGSRRRWVRVLIGAVVAMTLLPVPAMAFSFLGGWRFTRSRSGGAPTPTVRARDVGDSSSLQISFGRNTSRRATTARLTARRNFEVESSRETVRLGEFLQTQLRNARADYRIEIRRFTRSGFLNARTIDLNTFLAGPDTTTFTRDNFFDVVLPRGTYRITLTATYRKSANGRYDDTINQAATPDLISIGGV